MLFVRMPSFVTHTSAHAQQKQNLFVQTFSAPFPVSTLAFEFEQFLACGPNHAIAACPAREPTRVP